jgi:hypothetical protein
MAIYTPAFDAEFNARKQNLVTYVRAIFRRVCRNEWRYDGHAW